MEQGAASVRIKSYFAGSVEQAIQEARKDLGPEAMLITSRRSSPQAQHLGAYEVVFGLPGEKQEQRTAPQPSDLSSELQILRAQLDEIKRTLQATGAVPQGAMPPEIEALYRDLVNGDLDSNIARQIADETCTVWLATPAATRSLAGSKLVQQLAADIVRKRLNFATDSAKTEQDDRRILVFAGPPGAGKTTTLTKIAIQECLSQRMTVRIISVDPNRVAAHEKLRIFAGILGVGFTAANSMQEFIEAVDEFRNKNCLLIDTPGYSAHELDNASDLTGFLAQLTPKEIHLVLSASMKRGDLMRCIRQFSAFEPDYLLFTKLDETESHGAILSAALESNKPLSFFAAGQSIPENLNRANAEALLETLFVRELSNATSAA